MNVLGPAGIARCCKKATTARGKPLWSEKASRPHPNGRLEAILETNLSHFAPPLLAFNAKPIPF